MFSAAEFLSVMVSATQRRESDRVAKASVSKNELLFRDFAKDHLTEQNPDFNAEPEWQLPPKAMQTWNRIRPVEVRSRGFLDLVLLPKDQGDHNSPSFGVEFKFWYWFDVLKKSKYADSGPRYHHLISKSFEMDATKLISAKPHDKDGRLIVTVISTLHVDQVQLAEGQNRGEFLVERGFPKSYVPLSGVNSRKKEFDIAALRESALVELSSYLRGRGCETVAGGNLTCQYAGLTTTTDFVVSEVPIDFRAN